MPKTTSQTTCTILTDNAGDITRAAELIKSGQLIAFATETVYGLGGDATNDHAVAAIFKAKGRPRFNPLIVHFAETDRIAREVEFDARACALADAFWPGPLSLVLPRRPDSRISLLASAGLDSLAVRIPDHPAARTLIIESETPIAAPSANRSTHVSPTCAEHVVTELGSAIAAVIDGGACTVGIESTVLDLSEESPVILRPGKITEEQLEPILGALGQKTADIQQPNLPENSPVKSPGLQKRHYAPAQPLRMNADEARPHESLLGFGPEAPMATLNLSPSGNLEEAAANLFAMIRTLDQGDFQGIAVTPVPEDGLGRAINDRLRRAARS